MLRIGGVSAVIFVDEKAAERRRLIQRHVVAFVEKIHPRLLEQELENTAMSQLKKTPERWPVGNKTEILDHFCSFYGPKKRIDGVYVQH